MNYFHDMVDNIHQKRIWRPWNQCESICLHLRRHIWNSSVHEPPKRYVELAIFIGKGSSLAVIMGNLAKIPPQQVFADSGRGRHVESGFVWCRAGIIERFEKFKMAAKMAT